MLPVGRAPFARRSSGSGAPVSPGGPLDELLEWLRSQGHDRAWLRVFTGSGRGSRFYAKLGWLPTWEHSRSTYPPYAELLRYGRYL